MYKIKQALHSDSDSISKIVRTANRETDLTKNSYVVNLDNVTKYFIQNAMDKGDLYYLLSYNQENIGVVSLSKINSSKPIIRRLAILPEYQKRGLGIKLLNHVENIALELGKSKITLGVRDDKPKLINWYKTNSYIVTNTRPFKKYPFQIVFMEKEF